LAKEIVTIRKAKERLMTAKSQMNSVSMTLSTSMSMLKVQGTLAKSTEVMKQMNALVKLPELNETIKAMAREMMHAGFIEDTIDDTFAILEPDDLETQADVEVNNVIAELTNDILAPAGLAPTTKIASKEKVSRPELSEAEEAAAQADLLALQARHNAL
jgi:charged multivesicular body protein 3